MKTTQRKKGQSVCRPFRKKKKKRIPYHEARFIWTHTYYRDDEGIDVLLTVRWTERESTGYTFYFFY